MFFGTQVFGHCASTIFVGIFSGCSTPKSPKQHGFNSRVPSPGPQVSTDPLLRVRLEELVELGRTRRWWYPEEISEKVESPGATRAVGILLKQHNYSMLLVHVVLLVSELLSVLNTLFD